MFDVVMVTALNSSLAVVGCDEYTDLCTRFHVTAFPTVLLFTPPTINDPAPLTGILDSTHLLKALAQSSDEPGEIPLVKQYNGDWLKFQLMTSPSLSRLSLHLLAFLACCWGMDWRRC